MIFYPKSRTQTALVLQFKITTVLVLFLAFFTSCQAPEPITNPEKGQKVTTKIIFSGDFVIEQELPILETDHTSSRAEPTNDIYAFQVDSREASDPIDAYTPYAYGLFDDLSMASIELDVQKRYRICVSMIRDGKDAIEVSAIGYSAPFLISGRNTPLDNRFIYTSTKRFTTLNLGAAEMKQDIGFAKTYERPPLNRYMGELLNFEPAAERPIEVMLKRVVFGIHLTAPELSDGYVELSIDGAPKMTIKAGTERVEQVFTLKGDANSYAWIEDNYIEGVVCKVKWFKTKGQIVNLGPKEGHTINVKRKFSFPVEVNTAAKELPSFVVLEDEKMIEQPKVVF